MSEIPEWDDTPAWAILLPLLPMMVFLLLLSGMRGEDVVEWAAHLRMALNWVGRYLYEPEREER
jgi:hypothetical protein